MADTLRTRIAAAIMDSCHGVYLDDAVDAADAVIRELGMTEFRVEHPVAERWWATKVEPIDD